MNDMNFFAPYLATKQKKKVNGGKLFLSLLISIAILAPIGGFGYEYSLKTKNSSMQEVLNKPENQEIIKKINTLHVRLNLINQAIPEVQNKDTALKSTELITENTLQVIIDSLPKQVQFNSLTMNNSESIITGTATDKPAIAELEYNLRKTGLMDSLLVSNITKNEGGQLDFVVNFKLKDVKAQ